MSEQQVVELKRRKLVLMIAVLVLVAVGFLAYRAGSTSRVVTEEVGCLSAEGTIGCVLSDGWDVSIPLDVSWTDARGAFHDGGRPRCLPPTGRGLEGPVRISWTEVEVDGIGWRQVLHVACMAD
jgi:hypothetical protein